MALDLELFMGDLLTWLGSSLRTAGFYISSKSIYKRKLRKYGLLLDHLDQQRN
jgi:hypothetical protein